MIVTIALKMIVDAAFEQLGNPMSTNWCIAVHFFDYLFYSSACMHISFIFHTQKNLPLLICNHRKFYSWLFNFAGIIYASYAGVELSYINVAFKDYNVAMFEGNYALSHTFLIAFFIFLYLLTMKIKRLNKSLNYV